MLSPSSVRLDVRAAGGSYPLTIGRGLGPAVEACLSELREAGARLAAVADAGARKALASRYAFLLEAFPLLEIPPGESSKSLAQYAKAVDFFAASGLGRDGVAIAFGGGVAGDLAGFAAATYLRGIRLVQIPTTLLAMVDSSVGGKTGVNIDAGKNLVGAFHQPMAVFADTECLSALPPREFAAGMAEVIKYGLLAEAALFESLERAPLTRWSDERLSEVVARCCQIKADIVSADERETAVSGGRALLNLGHTFGHAIENVAGYGQYLHGEAVAIGLAAAARLSHRLGAIGPSEVSRVDAALEAHGLPARLARPLPLEGLMRAMGRDKKARAGRLRFVALAAIGQAVTAEAVPAADAEAVWRAVGAA